MRFDVESMVLKILSWVTFLTLCELWTWKWCSVSRMRWVLLVAHLVACISDPWATLGVPRSASQKDIKKGELTYFFDLWVILRKNHFLEFFMFFRIISHQFKNYDVISQKPIRNWPFNGIRTKISRPRPKKNSWRLPKPIKFWPMMRNAESGREIRVKARETGSDQSRELVDLDSQVQSGKFFEKN